MIDPTYPRHPEKNLENLGRSLLDSTSWLLNFIQPMRQVAGDLTQH